MNKDAAKIALCNIALRPKPDPFPPVACTTLYNVLSGAGYNPIFYDIDVCRPSPEELSGFFAAGQFDIVGISAVVSTGYRYTKDLAGIIKKASPKTRIILGGNLAASYEIILKKCNIDICVIGEGEGPLLKLVEHFQAGGDLEPASALEHIKGIAFLGPDGKCRFTGRDHSSGDLFQQQADYKILEKFSDINHYISYPAGKYGFIYDERSRRPYRSGKKTALVFSSRGCVNRCTFCHRWIEGYRIFTPESVVDNMKFLMAEYNVGFFYIGDECFGESREWLEKFIDLVKPLDILFQVTGIRVSVVKKDAGILRRLKEAGLTALFFGMESGSSKILSVMEKNATREENMLAAKICADEGIYTIIQLVIGMPGENDETIDETIDFINRATKKSLTSTLSVNYLQALPGTPCYDFLRYHGILGKDIDDEEKYLFKVADMNAADVRQYTNVSEADMARVKLWKSKLFWLTEINWLKNHGWKFPAERDTEFYAGEIEHRNLRGRIRKALISKIWVYRMIDMMGGLFWAAMLLRNRILVYGAKRVFLMGLGIVKEEDRSRFKIEARSLREIMAEKKKEGIH